MDLNNLINQSQFQKYASALAAQGLSDSSIRRKLSALTTFHKFLAKKKLVAPPTVIARSSYHNDVAIASSPVIASSAQPSAAISSSPTIPPTPNRLKTFFFNHYFIVASVLLLLSGLGYTLYTQVFNRANKNLAYSSASSPVAPNRILSFQGRLTDSSGNPITSSTGILFKLFTLGSGGTELYTSGAGNSQTVIPDENGIFSVVIGKSHGLGIPSSVFSENAEVWLEITSGGETMNPRQQIATVGYALNSETLQGLPPSASGMRNTVLVIDGSGNLNLGETSPTIISQSGTLGIIGQAILIGTSDGSGGNITINPDGAGKLKFITEGTGSTATGGLIEATNANLASGNLYSAYINNDNRGYKFLDFSNYNVGTTTLSSRFSIDAYGNLASAGTINTSIGITTPRITISVGATSGYILQTDAFGNASWVNPGSAGIGTSYDAGNGLTKVGSVFKFGGAITENTRLNIGNTEVLYVDYATGKLGLGTSSPASKLEVQQTVNNWAGGLAIANATASQKMFMFIDALGNRRIDASSDGSQNISLNGTGTGFVGIGTTAPSYKLHVNGDALISTRLGIGSTHPLYAFNVGGTSMLTDIFSYGSFGLGTTAPTYKLELVGSNSIFRIGDTAGNTLVDISETNAQFNLPTTFTSTGDVNMANDLNFTNQTASTIRSNAPLYFEAGESFENNDLTLKTFGTGNVVFDSAGLTLLQAQSWTLASGTTNALNISNGLISIDTLNSRVGIGTSSPTKKLDVAGDINLTGTIYTTGASGSVGQVLTSTGSGLQWATNVGTTYTFTNGVNLTGSNVGLGGTLTSNTIINTGANSLSFLGLGNSQSFFVGASGFVGIGTTNPTEKLEVTGNIVISSGTSRTISVASATAVPDSTLTIKAGRGLMGSDGGNLNLTGGLTTSGSSGGSVYINPGTGLSNSGNIIIANLNGNVGIGTSSPTKKLDVAGDINLTGTIFTTGTSGTSGQVLTSTGTGLAWVNNVGTTYTFQNGINLTGSNVGLGGTLTQNTQIGTSSFHVDFIGLGGTQSLHIDESGNVGIGTTSPSEKLTLNGGSFRILGGGAIYMGTNSAQNGTINLPNNNAINFRNTSNSGDITGLSVDVANNTVVGGGNYLVVTAGGNVGIGTTNPTAKLEIGGTNGQILISNMIKLDTTGNNAYIAQASRSYFIDLYNEEIRARQFNLNIATGGTNTDITFNPNRNTNFVTGLVGIGTTNPSKKLDITGDINLTGTIFSNGTSGTSGQVLTSTGTGLQWVNAASVGGTYTFTNGLTNTAGTVGLGGTLTSNTTINTGANSLSFLGLGNSQSLYISSTGNIGVGHTNPTEKIHIYGGLNNMASIINSGMSNFTVGGTLNSTKFFTSEPAGDGKAAIVAVGGAVPSSQPLTISTLGNYGGVGIVGGASNVGGGRLAVGVHGYGRTYSGAVNNPTYGVYGLGEVDSSITNYQGSLYGIYAKSSAIGATNSSGGSIYGLYSEGIGASSNKVYGGYFTATGGASNFGVYSSSGINYFNDSVGIGTTSPTKKLDVSGDINLTGTIFSAGVSGTSGQVLTSTGTGLQWVNAGSVGGTYTFTNGITNSAGTVGLGGTLTSTNTIINTGANSLSFLGLGNTQGLFISPSGNIGIGNTDPSYKLDVNGNVKIGTSSVGFDLQLYASGSDESVKWDAANSRLVGTDGTLTKFYLQAKGSQNDGIFTSMNAAGTGKVAQFGDAAFNIGSGGLIRLYNTPTWALGVDPPSISATEVLEISSVTGSIGINPLGGASAPTNQILNINWAGNSASNLTAIKVEGSNSGGGAFSAATFGGNVGINNTTPAYDLDITGDINLTGTIFSNGTSGTNGQVLTSTGTGLQWVNAASVGGTYTFTNGLTNTAGTVGLGGTLTSNTQIGLGSYNLTLGTNTSTPNIYLTSAGKVGVGTTSPDYKFSVGDTTGNYVGIQDGSIYGGWTADKRYIISQNGSLDMGIPDNGGSIQLASSNGKTIISGATSGVALFKVYVGSTSTPALTILNSSNNVGIGTTNPLKKLQVSGGTIGLDFNQALQGAYSVGGTDYFDLIKLGASNSVTVGNTTRDTSIVGGNYVQIAPAGGSFSFYSTQFYPTTTNTSYVGKVDGLFLQGNFGSGGINVTGSIGIGTSSPSKKLDVVGDINLTGTIFSNGTSGTNGQVLTSTGTGLQWVNAGSVGGTYTFTNGITNTAGTVGLGGTLTSNTIINTGANSLSFLGLGNSQSLFVGASGFIGIGTTNPTEKINVIGNGKFTGNLSINNASINTNYGIELGLWGNNSRGTNFSGTLTSSNATLYGSYNTLNTGGIGISGVDVDQYVIGTHNSITVNSNFDPDNWSLPFGIGTQNNFNLTGNTSVGIGLHNIGNINNSGNALFFGVQNNPTFLSNNGYFIGLSNGDFANDTPITSSQDSSTLYGMLNSFSTTGAYANIRGTYNILGTGGSNSSTIGVHNEITIGGENSNGHGVYNSIATVSDSLPQTIYGSYINNLTYDPSDIGYGLYTNVTGGGSNFAIYSESGTNYFSGEVGIGTTSPGRKLSIGIPETLTQANNDVAIFDDTSAYLSLRATSVDVEAIIGTDNTNGLGIYTSTNNKISFGTNNTQKMVLNATGGLSIGGTYFQYDPGIGNVIIQGSLGIGTTLPTKKLDVAGDVKLTGTLFVGAGVTGSSGQVLSSTGTGLQWITAGVGSTYTFTNGLTNNSGTVGLGGTLTSNTIINTGANSLSFLGLGNTQSLFIGASGYVGIGTTNPIQKLTVTGNINSTGNLALNNGSINSNYGIELGSWGNDSRGINFSGTLTSQNSSISGLYNTLSTGGIGLTDTAGFNQYVNGVYNDITINSDQVGSSYAFGTGVKNTFNMSGADYPNAYGMWNSVSNFSAVSSYFIGLQNADGQTPGVGITTNVNNVTLTGVYNHFETSGEDTSIYGEQNTLNTTGNYANIYGQNNNITVGGSDSVATGTSNEIDSVGDSQVQTLAGNNVNINLAEEGDIGFGYYSNVVGSTENAYAFFAEAGKSVFLDNVGIGATSPRSRLEVVGTNSTATVGADFITNGGFSVGTGWSGTPTDWVISGGTAAHITGNTTYLEQPYTSIDSMYKVTFDTSFTDGTLSVSFGNSQQQDITASGNYILYFITGVDPTGLHFMPTSDWDGTIDNVTAQEITGSQANLILQNDQALGSWGNQMDFRTSQGNMFVGENSGKYYQGWGDNTSFGSNALVSLINGYGNIAIGQNYDYSSTYGVLGKLTTGNSNVALGAYTGQELTEGNQNTFIGHRAGRLLSGTSSGNVFIGANAGSSLTSVNDTLYIDNGYATNPLIYGNFASGRIGLGTTNPIKTLDITGDINLTGTIFAAGISGSSGQVLSSTGTGLQWISAGVGSTYIFTNGLTNTAGTVGLGGTLTSNTSITAITFGLGIGTTGNSLYKLSVGGTAAFSNIITTGNVGIGLSNPAYPLEIFSNNSTSMRITGPSTQTQLLLTTTSNRTWAITNAGSSADYGAPQGSLTFQDITAGVNRMVLTSTGNVGIGLSTPIVARLQILGAGSSHIAIFDGSGNVGIGTTAPSNKLDVAGDINLTGTIFAAGISGSAGQVLSSTGVGLSWIPTSAIGSTYTFTNGLTNTAGTVGLGGTLTSATFINTGANSLSFLGLGNTQSLFIGASGYVGIGTTNPQNIFHLNDGGSNTLRLQMTNSVTGNSSTDGLHLAVDNVGDAFIIQRESANLRAYTSNLERLRIDSAGRVGIGTTNPTEKLSVSGLTGEYNLTVTDGGFRTFGVFMASGGPNAIGLGTKTAYPLYFFTSGSTSTPTMYLTTGNLVGIGTTAPSKKLDVTGDIKLTGTLFVGAGVTGSNNQVLASDGAGSLQWIASGGVGTTYAFTNGLTNNLNTISLGGTLTSNTIINTGANSLSFLGLGNTQSLFIGASGYVGIGTTNPQTLLDLVLNENANNTWVSVTNTNSGANSKTGFWSNSDSAGGGVVSFSTNYSSTLFRGRSGLFTDATNALGLDLVAEAAGGDMRFYTGGDNERMRISATGNVGIGNTNPTGKFQINVGNTQSIFVNASGNVSIGSTNDNTGAKIDIAGGHLLFSSAGSVGTAFSIKNNGSNQLELMGGSAGLNFKNSSNSSILTIGGTGNLTAIGNGLFGYALGTSGPIMGLGVSGSVGIGTTSPSKKLDVSGDINLTGTIFATGISGSSGQVLSSTGTGLQWVTNTGTTYSFTNGLTNTSGTVRIGGTLTQNTQIGTSSFGLSILGLGGSQALYIGTSGYVGVGTAAPTSPLMIAAPSGTFDSSGSEGALRIQLSGGNKRLILGYDSADYGYISSLDFGTPTNLVLQRNGGNVGIGANPTGLFQVNVGNTQALYVGATNSFVGIGTSAPSKKLDIIGDIKLTGTIFVGAGVTGSNGQILASNGAGGLQWVNDAGGTGGSSYTATNGLTLTGSAFGLGGTLTQNTDIATSSFGLSLLGLGNSQALFVGASGYVGIGTTAPTSKLQISLPGSTTNSSIISIGNAGNPTAGILGNSGTNGINFRIAGGSTLANIVFATNSLDRMQITNNGDVGIGTTVPNGKLHVLGAGSSHIAIFDGSGNVGIGTTNPGYKFELTSSVNNYLGYIYNVGTTTNSGGLYIRSDGLGNVFNANYAGTDLLTVSPAQTTINNPANFTSAGDISAAYDLNFTNATASTIRSSAPLYLTSGEVFNSSNLNLTTYNSGRLVLDTPGGVVLSQAQNWTLGNGTTSTTALNIQSGLLNIDTQNSFVGIGTTAPTLPLTVQRSGSATLLSAFSTINPNSALTTGSGILFQMTNVGTTTINYGGISAIITDNTNGSEDGILNFREIVAGSLTNVGTFHIGNFGIGTTTPSKKLDVVGDIKLTGTVFVGAGVTGASGQVLSSNGAGSLSWITPSGSSYTSANGVTMVGSVIGLGGSLGQNTTIGTSSFIFNIDGTLTAGKFASFTDPTNYFIDPSNSTVTNASASFHGAGSILFNTATIGSTQVSITANSSTRLKSFSNGFSIATNIGATGVGSTINWDDALFVDPQGDIGIGTTSPVGLFNVATGGTHALVIASNGSVGFGTTSPLGVFEVKVNGTGGTSAFNIAANGKVGIGTSLASIYQLQVIGNSTSGVAFIRNLATTGNTMPTLIVQTAGTGLGTTGAEFVRFLSSTGAKVGRIRLATSATTVAYATSGSNDLAEYMLATEPSNAGDLMSFTGEKFSRYTPDSTIGGIHSSYATLVGNENIADQPNAFPLAISGIVKLKVNTENGPIHPGDPLSGSNMIATASKAVKPGYIVARALQDYTNSDPSQVGTIEVIVGLNWYDPDIMLTDSGEINVNHNISDEVLASLGYNASKNEIEAAQYSLNDSLGRPVTRLAQFAQISSAKIKAGLISTTNLIAKNIVAETTKSKSVQTAVLTPLSDITDTIVVEGSLAVNGTLVTDKLESKEATISTLYAENIISKEGNFGQLMTDKITALREEIRNTISSIGVTEAVSTPSALVADAPNWTFNTSTSQTEIHGDVALSDNMVIGAKLSVLGDTQLGNAFVTGTFTAGEVAIKENFIETTASMLHVQPSGLGSVHIMNDTLIIAENGEVTLNGNLAVSGNINTTSLFASLINSDEINTKKLTAESINVATASATPIIAESGFAALATTSAQVSTNATAGTATLPTGKTELVIYNEKITQNSIIYLTPVGSTNNQVVYLKSKNVSPAPTPESTSSATTPSSFVIALDAPLLNDVAINWWIIN